MQYTLKKDQVESYNESITYAFPKYTTQLINWANQNAQGTRPKVVGQMSELFPEFMNTTSQPTITKWREWYLDRNPNALENATEKIYLQVQNLQKAISLIDREMVKQWVEDLVICKTFNGLYVQKAILASLAEMRNTTYRLATPAEEAKGIDGFVGVIPYSIKPDTYKTMERLPETIQVKMIYYSKGKDKFYIEVQD